MSHIFISYSRVDTAYAFKLKNKLQEEGFDVWIDNERLVASNKWQELIGDAIYRCSAFVLIMSPASEESEWVQKELSLAQTNRKIIFPLLLQGREWKRSIILANLQYEDVTDKSLPSSNFYDGLEDYVQRQHGKHGHDVTPEEVRLKIGDLVFQSDKPITDPNKTKREPAASTQNTIMMSIVMLVLVVSLTLVALFSIFSLSNRPDDPIPIEPTTVDFGIMRANGIPIWAAPEEDLERRITVFQGAKLIGYAKTETDGQPWYLVRIPGRSTYGWVFGKDVYVETGELNKLPAYDSFADAKTRFPIEE